MFDLRFDVEGWWERCKEFSKKEEEVDNREVYFGSYCSREKVFKLGEECKFIEMYGGFRFDLFREIVRKVDLSRVFIFSGLYGIVLGSEVGKVYDRYFELFELEDMIIRVKDRFKKLGNIKVVYYIDEYIYRSWWYIEVVYRSCKELGIECVVKDVVLDEVIDWEEVKSILKEK